MDLNDIKDKAESVYGEENTTEYKEFEDKFKPKKIQTIVIHLTVFMKWLRIMFRLVLKLTATNLYVRFIRVEIMRSIIICPTVLLLIIHHFQF